MARGGEPPKGGGIHMGDRRGKTTIKRRKPRIRVHLRAEGRREEGKEKGKRK